MATWDVFHSDRLVAERGLTTEAVAASLARGDLLADDLIRPAGTSGWKRLGDLPEFQAVNLPPAPAPVPVEPEPELPQEFAPASDSDSDSESDYDVEVIVEDDAAAPEPPPPVLPAVQTQRPDLPELAEPEAGVDDFWLEDEDEDDGEIEDDEEAAEFTLSRNEPEKVEELDLAAMVDVAFQLVLFFLVTATSVVFKTLEVPKPNEDKPPEAAAQARAKSIDELKDDYILVEVDAAGAIKVDRQPVPSDRAALMEKLRTAREATSRKAMLLSADFAARHKSAVLAFDVASEIGLSIAIAQPTGKK